MTVNVVLLFSSLVQVQLFTTFLLVRGRIQSCKRFINPMKFSQSIMWWKEWMIALFCMQIDGFIFFKNSFVFILDVVIKNAIILELIIDQESAYCTWKIHQRLWNMFWRKLVNTTNSESHGYSKVYLNQLIRKTDYILHESSFSWSSPQRRKWDINNSIIPWWFQDINFKFKFMQIISVVT